MLPFTVSKTKYSRNRHHAHKLPHKKEKWGQNTPRKFVPALVTPVFYIDGEKSSLQDFRRGNFSHKGIKQNEVTMPQGFAGHNGAKITSQTYIIE